MIPAFLRCTALCDDADYCGTRSAAYVHLAMPNTEGNADDQCQKLLQNCNAMCMTDCPAGHLGQAGLTAE